MTETFSTNKKTATLKESGQDFSTSKFNFSEQQFGNLDVDK